MFIMPLLMWVLLVRTWASSSAKDHAHVPGEMGICGPGFSMEAIEAMEQRFWASRVSMLQSELSSLHDRVEFVTREIARAMGHVGQGGGGEGKK